MIGHGGWRQQEEGLGIGRTEQWSNIHTTETPSGAGAEGALREISLFLEQLGVLQLETPIHVTAPWTSSTMLCNSVKNIKISAKQASDTCTKIGVIGVSALKGDVKDSIYVELLGYIQQMRDALFSVIEAGEFNSILMKYICVNIRAEIHLINELLLVIEKGEDVSLANSVGMVWKAKDKVQKIPESNKAAFKRCILETASVIEDTSREFQEYIEMSKSNAKEPTRLSTSPDDSNDEFDDLDMGDCTYSASELPLVETAVDLIGRQKKMLRLCISVISEVGETVTNNIEDIAIKSSCFTWISECVDVAKETEDVVIDLGADLYSPVDPDVVDEMAQKNWIHLSKLAQKLLQPTFDITVVSGGPNVNAQHALDRENIQELLKKSF